MEEPIVVRCIIQIAGKPKENVEKALQYVDEKLGNASKDYKLKSSEMSIPELDEESTLYSAFLDVVLEFEEVGKILEFILDYTPNSVEIESPQELTLDSTALTGVLNDFSNHFLKMNDKVRRLNAHIHQLQSGENKK
jgi:hypothetical protein